MEGQTEEQKLREEGLPGVLGRVGAFGMMGSVVLFGAFNMLMLVAGCLSGDTGSYTISGSAKLDSPGLPWYVHWSHASFGYLPPVMGIFAVLFVLGLAMRKPKASINPISGARE